MTCVPIKGTNTRGAILSCFSTRITDTDACCPHLPPVTGPTLPRMPNALKIIGLKHVCDNLLKRVMGATSFYDDWLSSSHELERLLSKVIPREAFRAHCIPQEAKARSVRVV